VKIRTICDDAVSGLRLVVEDLQPAAVDELGLVGALHELVATMATDEVTIELSGEPSGDLPAAVEVAAFRITSEALHNAIRHADPRRIDVHVWTDPQGLLLRIQDDGAGIAPDARPGVGLASMRRRAEELGGALDVESTNHGTLVRATLPVRR
jgi:signal transduction histidine kinase